MATFVDITTEDDHQTRDLVIYINSLKKEGFIISPEEQQGIQEEQKLKEILSKIIGHQNLVFSEAQEKDIENCFHVICSLMRKLDIASVDELTKKLIQNIISDTTDRPQLRLKILNNLYNMFDNDSISRYEVFMFILQYALDSKTTDVVIQHFKNLSVWLKIWGADVKQTRSLYKLVYTILEQANQRVEAYNALIKYLSTFDADVEGISSAKEEAVRVASQAIKLPEIHQCDELLEMPAVKQLEKDSTYCKLYELLKLFACDKLEDFQHFHEENPDYLKSVGISHDECLKKIRFLSLATLASENHEIPYSLVAETLNIPEEDVETWIILAISAGLIEAKMDQLRNIVVISRCTQRVFTIAQWKQLSDRLRVWKDNVRGLLHVVRTQHEKISEVHF